ncbi:YebY family protein [Deinococcus sp. HMF7604]|uniref:DUF2511 domain-containing protein n=1 Tax=Deinococcus betulae TaxID=2873312 RepID=UPI001CCF2841|nr:DUF2511 domain-containing protein [Deinococcus betulae]MBZ9750755.1 YebY family protein [Deinococcus betulae]
MTQRPELDAETKARIEAEEAYRAQVQAQQRSQSKGRGMGCGQALLWCVGIIVFFGVLTQLRGGGDPHSRPVTATEYADWPFQFSSGTLTCQPDQAITLAQANSTNVYALNGTALGQAKAQGWYEFSAAYRGEGSVGRLIEDGLKLC